jgi:hypothetical protein
LHAGAEVFGVHRALVLAQQSFGMNTRVLAERFPLRYDLDALRWETMARDRLRQETAWAGCAMTA